VSAAEPPAPPTPLAARERLTRRDVPFLLLSLLVVVAGAVVVALGFFRAFPEASIDFSVTRDGAREIAAKELAKRGFDVSKMKAFVVFDHDDDAKVFLERTLGLKRANPLYSTTVPIWRWSVRFVRPLERLEYKASVSPKGEVLGYRRTLPEKDAAADPGDAPARSLAEGELKRMRGLDASTLRFIETRVEKHPSRVDRTFVWESNSVRFGDAALRYLVQVQGGRVGRSTTWLEVPESWKKEYAHLRSKNEAASVVATFGFVLTIVALLVVFVERVRRRDVKWRLAMAFGLLAAALQLGASLNELPLRFYDYETTQSWASFLASGFVRDLGLAFFAGLGVGLLVAGGEPLYREGYPDKLALGRIFSPRGLRSRRFFRAVVLGWALVAFFFAYQVLFYIGAEKLGAWAPADVPYSNLLGTSFPWLAVLLAGFMPAVTEELSSRMFSIPFAQKFLPTWAAVALPAFIWGFGHAAYPNQPFYIRGVEVGLAGVVIGIVFLKEGILPLLVWHFTVDAVYTSLILVRSSNTYFVVSGLVAAGVLLLPLVVSVALYLKEGGFLPDAGLSNAAVGTCPPPPRAEPAPLVFTRASGPLVRLALPLLVLAVFVAALARGVLPRLKWGSEGEPSIGRLEARRAADAYLRSLGDDPTGYFGVTVSASALPALEEASDDGSGLVPYGWSSAAERWILTHGGLPALTRVAPSVLPGPVWQVRYVRPLDQHGAWIVVDARSGRVVGFKRTFPEEEAGASPDDAAARSLAAALVRSFGIDPALLTVVSTRGQARKSRRDTHIAYEAAEPVAEAPRRYVVEMAGDKPALFATALKLPEVWVRAGERTTPIGYLAKAWAVVGIGGLVALVLAELIRAVRHAEIPWRRLSTAAALLTVPTLLRQLVSIPLFLRALPQTVPLGLFSISVAVGVSVSLLLAFGGALLALVFIYLARPGALLAFRARLDGPRAAVASLGAALVLLSFRALREALRAAFPLAMGIGSFGFPPAADSPFPAADLLESAVRLALFAGAGAALAVLLLKHTLRSRPVRIVSCILLAGLFARWSAREGGDLLLPVLGGVIVATALLAAFALLLRDDPLAYALFGATIMAVRGVELLEYGVPLWTLCGALVVALALATFASLARPMTRSA
jgi:membrane protease YdiL (CAAX protease family)